MDTDKPLVSIIIPFSNAQAYLDQCLDSAVAQTYRNIEIICVDDGSADSSLEIARTAATEDNRLKVFSLGTNHGVSYARNFGMSKSTGKYIEFLDADDFIDSDYVASMVEAAEKSGCQMLQNNNVISFHMGGQQTRSNLGTPGSYTVDHKSQRLITAGPCNKLYKADIIRNNNVIFPEGIRIGEDLLFNFNYMLYIDKMHIINGPAYHYRIHNKSSLRKIPGDNDSVKVYSRMYQLLKTTGSEKKFFLPFLYMRRDLREAREKKKMFRDVHDFFIEIREDVENNENLYSKKDIKFFNSVVKSSYYSTMRIRMFLSKLIRS